MVKKTTWAVIAILAGGGRAWASSGGASFDEGLDARAALQSAQAGAKDAAPLRSREAPGAPKAPPSAKPEDLAGVYKSEDGGKTGVLQLKAVLEKDGVRLEGDCTRGDYNASAHTYSEDRISFWVKPTADPWQWAGQLTHQSGYSAQVWGEDDEDPTEGGGNDSHDPIQAVFSPEYGKVSLSWGAAGASIVKEWTGRKP